MPNKTERLQDLGVVLRILNDLNDADVLDDRREYDEEEFQLSYPDLSSEQVSYLNDMVQSYFEPDVASLYRSRWSDGNARILAETITEAIHQDFDGWSDGEKVIIRLFLHDLGRAVKADHKWDDSERYAPG